ncbi:MAG TPA: carbohydrate ABC transporter substrate-binding protein, partial [Chloroflexi bacterium]|nr:carbohydrate ABC transporter substrate-binding protein [Chloroflexota bacterium]
MNKKLSLYIVVLAVIALVLAACGGDGETVEVTRIVEVTRVVEAAGEGGGEA